MDINGEIETLKSGSECSAVKSVSAYGEVSEGHPEKALPQLKGSSCGKATSQ